MFNRIFFMSALVISCVLLACNNTPETPAGGPCTYKETVYPALVTEFQKIDSNLYDIIFVLQPLDGKVPTVLDTVYYYLEKHSYLTSEDLKQQDIQLGDKYKYSVQEITSGSCSPTVKMLRMEKIK